MTRSKTKFFQFLKVILWPFLDIGSEYIFQKESMGEFAQTHWLR